MSNIPIPPSPIAAYLARCVSENRAPADLSRAFSHSHALDPRHALQAAVVLAAQAVDRAQVAVRAAQSALEMYARAYERAVKDLADVERGNVG